MLSRPWSTTVPKTMLVSGIAQSTENMALSGSAKIGPVVSDKKIFNVFYIDI